MHGRRLISAFSWSSVSVAWSLTAVAAGSSADLALFGKDPGDGNAFACYSRHYDGAHLAAHPQQNVDDMTIFVNSFVDPEAGRQYLLEMGVRFREISTPFQTSGGCGTVDGKKGLSCGIDCDGGEIDVTVRDQDSILVSIPDGARTWDPESGETPPANARFGLDDKLFRLDRTKLQDCLPLVGDDSLKAEISAAK